MPPSDEKRPLKHGGRLGNRSATLIGKFCGAALAFARDSLLDLHFLFFGWLTTTFAATLLLLLHQSQSRPRRPPFAILVAQKVFSAPLTTCPLLRIDRPSAD